MKAVKVPGFAKKKVKEILENTPKSPDQAILMLQKDVMEQKHLIEEALTREQTKEDHMLLTEVYGIFDQLEKKALEFQDKKRKLGGYMKAIHKVAKFPKRKRERYKELINYG
jgi:flagellin-specific chaperone FliS